MTISQRALEIAARAVCFGRSDHPDIDDDLVNATDDARTAIESYLEALKCPDCAVDPGVRHAEGCDVARCTGCGKQRLLHGHPGAPPEWNSPNIWTGEWPGDEEVSEGLATDLNNLAVKGESGLLRWDGQRWRCPCMSVTVADAACPVHGIIASIKGGML